MQNALLMQLGIEELRQVIREELNGIIPAITPTPKPKRAEYLTRRETAVKLHLSLSTLHQYTKTGRLQSYRVGSRVLYKTEEIDTALLAMHKTAKELTNLKTA